MPSKRTRAWRAPGRVNIIGEHIDYLGGTVLPFACDLELVVSVSDSDHIDIRSVDADAAPYVRGVEEALHAHGLPIHPCSGDITSAIPVGAGLSSSAAIAAGLALALTRGRRVSPALLQDAEIRASGVRGGVMDQTAVLESRAGHALLLDCATGTFEHVAIPEEISFVVIDTGTRRELTDGRYAQRRAEVEAGHPMRRAHTDAEQRRVFDAVDAMRAGDVASLGALVDASHASLRDNFEVSSPELDAAVAQAVALPGCTGARLVGGGFAGCVLAVVEAGAEQDVAAEFDTAYVVKAVDGAGPARST
jgi:galactokinase